jgi:hypothetical protein
MMIIKLDFNFMYLCTIIMARGLYIWHNHMRQMNRLTELERQIDAQTEEIKERIRMIEEGYILK